MSTSPLPVTSNVPIDATSSSPEAAEVSVSVCTVAFPAVATGHLVLKIEDYSRLKATHGENGSYIESSPFTVGGHSWKIRCYLNGDRKENAGFVSVYLIRICSDSDSAVLALFQFGLVRHQGTPPPAYGRQGKPGKVRTFGGKDDKYGGWGHQRVVRVKELERSGLFLKDDCFAVRCTVTVVEERTAAEEKVVVPAHDVERLTGMLCKCDDDMCKRHHARQAPAQTFLERVAEFCFSICRGGPA